MRQRRRGRKDRGRDGVGRHPSLQTGQAGLPHPAFQSVGSLSRGIGFSPRPQEGRSDFRCRPSQLRLADSAAGKPLRALASVLCPLFYPSFFHLPAFPSLHGRYPLLRYYGRSDSRQPDARTLCPSHPPALAGLPDCSQWTSGHSVSNHQCDDRGLPGCPAFRLLAYRPLCRLRLSLADSPVHTDRIEFTAAAPLDHLCYGLVVLVPLLSTPHCCDAVTVRYRTIPHRTEADFHRSFLWPSQAH